jgi:hypothetical protein
MQLAISEGMIDDRSNIVDSRIVNHRRPPGLPIDFDLGDVCATGESPRDRNFGNGIERMRVCAAHCCMTSANAIARSVPLTRYRRSRIRHPHPTRERFGGEKFPFSMTCSAASLYALPCERMVREPMAAANQGGPVGVAGAQHDLVWIKPQHLRDELGKHRLMPLPTWPATL